MVCIVGLCACAGPLATAAQDRTSALWGANGEKWTPQSRLPDFSHAGYRRGEEPFRIPTNVISLADFGVTGDGRTDDTAAFKKAIAAGAGKLIQIPSGRFVLSDRLNIRESNLVLRGAGTRRTVLKFVRPLEEISPNPASTDGKQPTSGWSWGGGLITIGVRMRSEEPSTKVVEPAKRGDVRLAMEKAVFRAGDEVVLEVHDDAQKTLLEYLYRGKAGDISGLNNWTVRQVFRVRSVDGRTATLDRGLRFDVRPEWKPVLRAFRPTVTDVGIEGIAFEFPPTPYAGHFREVGFNPVCIESGAAHCWLRDLLIWNADSGPYINGIFCTLDGIRLGADPARKHAQGHTGHHGITLQGSDCLCTNFHVETEFIHDLTVQSAVGCVFCSGRALNLNMDHHRWAPYENLFSNIDAGDGRRLFSSSGGGMRGLHSAAGATFWNLRARNPTRWPGNFSDFINVIGVNIDKPPANDPEGRWYEPPPAGGLQPADLYGAMLKRRLEKSGNGR